MNGNNIKKIPVNIYSKIGTFDKPTAQSNIKGICGDEMKFYLLIENDIISSVKFLTTGCYFTILCGNAVACEAEGKNIMDALKISPGQILSIISNLPEYHYHCTILAVSTLHKAIADYFLQKYSE
jgi:nitrogen fixation protein NifU and related proteins